MLMEFDVMKEPWIGAEDLHGRKCNITVSQAITEGQKYRRLDCSSLIKRQEYAVYRFLCAVYMDAFHPSEDFYCDLLEGCETLSKETFNNYIEACIREGVCFDVFDSEKPFMQAPMDSFKKLEPKTVANICPAMRKGINTVFSARKPDVYNGSFENSYSMSPSEFFMSLLDTQLGIQIGGEGYSASVTHYNGESPVFSILEGDNLQQTIIMTAGYLNDDMSNLGIPLWKWDMKHSDDERNVCEYYGISHPGVLTYAFMPARKIRVAEKYWISSNYTAEGAKKVTLDEAIEAVTGAMRSVCN